MFGKNSINTRIFFSSYFVLSFVHIANSIACFQCNSVEHPGCFELRPNDTNSVHYKECEVKYPAEPPFCRKTELRILMDFEAGEKQTRIIRACGYRKDYRKDRECYQKADKDHQEIQCQCFHDGCNTGSILSSSALLIFGLYFILSEK